jgi:hypothetical protein
MYGLVCSRTIYVGRTVQVDAQDAPSRKSKYQDVVRDRRSHEVGGYVKLQRYTLYVEHWERSILVLHVARAGRSIPARHIVRHIGLEVSRMLP